MRVLKCTGKFHSSFAVNGNWSEWGEYSLCSVSCGGGVQARYRECDNPLPAYGGKDCVGESEEIRPCNQFPCPGKHILGPKYSHYQDFIETVSCSNAYLSFACDQGAFYPDLSLKQYSQQKSKFWRKSNRFARS